MIFIIFQEFQNRDPTTFATDMLLAIQGFLFAFLILKLWHEHKEHKILFGWIATFFSIGIFALCGAISHWANLVSVADMFWPPTMIFGGLAFFFFNISVILYLIKDNTKKHLILPGILVIIYLVLLPLLDWLFIIFVAYQLVCSLMIYYYTLPKKKADALCRALILGLTILLIAGVIQAIGSILGLEFFYGADERGEPFIFKPHNDIFHLIAFVGIFIIYRGLKIHYKSL